MLNKRTLIPLLLLVLFVIPITSTAQTQQSISSFEIAIWPEYDRPAALVIYKVRLPEDSPTPAVLALPIPAAAGDPYAVAAWYPDGALDDNVTWTSTRQGDWTWIEVTTVTNGIWLEFYDEIAIDGPEREYAFTWNGDLAVDSLSFDVLHPLGSTDLRTNPSGEELLGSDGLPRTRLSLGARALGEVYSLSLSYTKPTAPEGALPTLRPNPNMAQFEIALWPEYDRAATLVILRGELNPDVALPAMVTIPIPASAGDPNAVAFMGDDNRLYSTDFERQPEGDWAWISFITEGRSFQLEYYDELVFDGTSRTYSFTWPGALNTASLSYELQQPVGATALVVTPAGTLINESDGLSYVRAGLGQQQAGSPITVSFQYEKSSVDLTVDAVSAAPTIDRPSTTQGGTPDLTTQLPFILGGFGAALIVLGVILYLRMRRDEKPSRKPPRTRQRKPKPQQAGADLDAAAVFCHVCGAKASASDHFCRSCGTKLRH